MGTYTVLTSLVFLVSLQYTAAIRCLSCNDVIQPRYCSGIEHCPEGDACVTESYRNRNGEYLYNVGCMSALRCSLTAHHNRSADVLRSDILGTHVHDVCTECCHSDLCNAAGCGTDGFPQQRGPVCLDCPQSRDPAYCDVISVCSQGEVCHVEEIYKFGEVFYKTSCSRKTDYECASPPIYNPMEVGKRSTGSCSFCCPDDLCNTKCNADTSLVPSTVESTTLAPSTVQTTPEPSTVQTTLAPLHSFKGKEFFLMFMKNLQFSYPLITLSASVTFIAPTAEIQVITSDNSTSDYVSGPVKHIDIDANMTMLEVGKTSKGIIVSSNASMSVTALNRHVYGTREAYLALPIERLGVSYIVGTSRPDNEHGKYGTSFAVGAPYDNTVVNITLSTYAVSLPSEYFRFGNYITVVLDRLDTFYIETSTSYGDLTGTRIVSDKPVAVVSGNVCSIRFGRNCNHLVEYLPPVSQWGTRFIVPPIMSNTSGTIRIIPSMDTTRVYVTNETSHKTYTISAYIDIDTNTSKPHAISSDNKPVLVLLIFYRKTYGMLLVPSISQFSNEPVLTTSPVASYYDNYIVVSIRSIDQSGLQIQSANGTDLPRVGSVAWPDADGEMYSFITVDCNNSQTCSVQHADHNVTFSVISYGDGRWASYAYPVNLML